MRLDEPGFSRVDEIGTVMLRPRLYNLHQSTRRVDSKLAAQVLRAIEVGLRALGRGATSAA